MSEQLQATSRIVDVISEHDSSRWIMLLNNRDGTAELLPVLDSPGTDKQLVLWSQRRTVRLEGGSVYTHPDTDLKLRLYPAGKNGMVCTAIP